MFSLPISILAIVVVTCVSDALGSGVDLQSTGPNEWFNSDLYLVNDPDQQQQSYQENKRYKRSYDGSYQSKGYGSGSYSSGNYGSGNYVGVKLNQGYQNGAQLGLHCLALSSTATNKWCYDNCLQGNCPKHVCSCSGEVYNRALKPSYGSYGKSGNYGQSGSYDQSNYGQSSYNQPKYGHSGSYGQSSNGQSNYGKTGSFGGYQKSGYQSALKIEPRYGQYEQQKIQY